LKVIKLKMYFLLFKNFLRIKKTLA